MHALRVHRSRPNFGLALVSHHGGRLIGEDGMHAQLLCQLCCIAFILSTGWCLSLSIAGAWLEGLGSPTQPTITNSDMSGSAGLSRTWRVPSLPAAVLMCVICELCVSVRMWCSLAGDQG